MNVTISEVMNVNMSPEDIRKTRDDWIRKSMSTGPDDIEIRDRSLDLVYRSIGFDPPGEVIHVGSPLDGFARIGLLSRSKYDDFEHQSNFIRFACDRVRSKFGDSQWRKIHSCGRMNWIERSDKFYEEVDDEVYIISSEESIYSGTLYSNDDIDWMSAYYVFRDYFPEELSIMDGIFNLILSTGWVWLFSDIAIISARPTELHFSDSNDLHCDSGPAVAYPDGFSLYRMHGVRVPMWLACDPAESIDPRKLVSMDNAEERKEFVFKVGIGRILKAFNARIVESSGLYELLQFDLGDGRYRPYLRMQNPSIDATHIEGVHPSCTTIQEALNYRNDLDSSMIDDVGGSDWYQQGDVILKPRDATKFKSRPKILT